MAATLCCRCGLRPAAATACNVVRFQSVTTSARTCAGRLISPSDTAIAVAAIARACELGLRVIVRLLFKAGARGSDGVNHGAGEERAQCTAAQLHINCG